MKSQVKPPKLKIVKPNPKGIISAFFQKHGWLLLYTAAILLCFFGIIYLFRGELVSTSKYFWVQVVAVFLGTIHVLVGIHYIRASEDYISWRNILFTTVLVLLTIGLVFLSHLGENSEGFPLIYLWAIVLFILPHIFVICYQYFNSIAKKQFQSWYYPYGKEIPVVEVVNPIKIKFYIAKRKEDDEYTEFALNVPQKYKLGEFMHYFIHRYNYDKIQRIRFLSQMITPKKVYMVGCLGKNRGAIKIDICWIPSLVLVHSE